MIFWKRGFCIREKKIKDFSDNHSVNIRKPTSELSEGISCPSTEDVSIFRLSLSRARDTISLRLFLPYLEGRCDLPWKMTCDLK